MNRSKDDSAPGGDETAILEVAVYTVHSPEEYPEIRAKTRHQLAMEPGYLWWQPLQPGPAVHETTPADSGDAILYADVLAWRSIEAAQAAAQKVESDAAYRDFATAINAIRHFTHYRAGQTADTLNRIIEDSNIIELAAYEVRDPASFAPAQSLLYQKKLPGRSGLIGGARMQRLFDEKGRESQNGFGDLLGWRDTRAWQDTGAAMMADPELKSFFEGIAETRVFALFTKDAQSSAGPRATASASRGAASK